MAEARFFWGKTERVRSHCWMLQKSEGKVSWEQPERNGLACGSTFMAKAIIKVIVVFLLGINFYKHLDVSKNSGFSPQIIHYFNRVFHDFHHPFWGKHP